MKNKTLKISPQRQKYLRQDKKSHIITTCCQTGLFLLILGLWEGLVAINLLDGFFVSSPSRVAKTLWQLMLNGEIFTHSAITLGETIMGFSIATVLGTLIAIVLWWIKPVRRILEPYILTLNSLPKVALGPLIIMWAGAGTGAILTMCVLICIFVTCISMMSALVNCDKDKILLLSSMGANKFQILCKLILPNAKKDFMSVLKINVGLSWIGTVMGEYLSSKSGLGYLIVNGSNMLNMDLVMTSTIVLCFLASFMSFIVGKIEKKFQ